MDVLPNPAGATLLAREIARIERRLAVLEAPGGTQLAQMVKQLQERVRLLQALQTLTVSEWRGYADGKSGWWKPVTDATVTTPTGRIEVRWGGSVSFGGATFAIEVSRAGAVVLSRDGVASDPSRRVNVEGGASFIPSNFNGTVVSVTPNVPVTVSLWALPDGGSSGNAGPVVSFHAARLTVQATL